MIQTEKRFFMMILWHIMTAAFLLNIVNGSVKYRILYVAMELLFTQDFAFNAILMTRFSDAADGHLDKSLS